MAAEGRARRGQRSTRTPPRGSHGGTGSLGADGGPVPGAFFFLSNGTFQKK